MKGVVSSSPVQVTVYNVPRIEHALPSTTNVTSGKTGLLLQCGGLGSGIEGAEWWVG